MKKMLCIGDRVYCGAGVKGEIVATRNKEVCYVLIDGDSTAKAMYIADLHPAAESIFKIGDKVRSKISFRGVVTGFEEETNRVICRSQHQDPTDRQRYAYRIDELLKDIQSFKENKIYKLAIGCDIIKVRALPFPNSQRRMAFYRVDNGEYVTSALRDEDPSRLRNHGFIID